MAERLKVHIFYSWQSDLPNPVNRGFIEKTLEKAATSLKSEADLEIEPVVDRDTRGIPGAPDIAATILEKIDKSQIVVADVSIINKGAGTRPTPNPNVLFELGYAAKVLGWKRLVLIFNTEYGDPADLPFDLRMKRLTTYHLAPGSSDNPSQRADLAKKLEMALREIVLDLKKTAAVSIEPFNVDDFAFEEDKRVVRYQPLSARYLHQKEKYGSYAIHSLTVQPLRIPADRLESFLNWPLKYTLRPERHPAGYTRRSEINQKEGEPITVLAVTCSEDGHIVTEGYLKIEETAVSAFLAPWLVGDLNRHLQLSKEVFQGVAQEFICIVTFFHIESFTWIFSGPFSRGLPYSGYHLPIKQFVNMESISGRDQWNKVAEPTKIILLEVGKIFGLSELPEVYWDEEGFLLGAMG